MKTATTSKRLTALMNARAQLILLGGCSDDVNVAHIKELDEEISEFKRGVDFVADVEAFSERFGVSYDGPPRVLPDDLAEFRRKFLHEECVEYSDASHLVASYLRLVELNGVGLHDHAVVMGRIRDNLADCLDALVDAVYVAIGTAILHGFDFREAWRRVHEANMRKVRAVSADESKRGHAFDVVKPPGWTAPDLADLVADHAHEVTE